MRANLPMGSTSATAPPNGNWFARLAVATSRISGRPTTFLLAVTVVACLGYHGSLVRFQRHLAARYQHGHDDRDVPDGLSDSGYAEPRHAGPAVETRRADPGDQERKQPHRRHRGGVGRRTQKSEGRSSRTCRLIPIGAGAAERFHSAFRTRNPGPAMLKRAGCIVVV